MANETRGSLRGGRAYMVRVGAGGPSPTVCARIRLGRVTPLGRSLPDSLIQVEGALWIVRKQKSGVPVSDQRLNPGLSCDPVFAIQFGYVGR